MGAACCSKRTDIWRLCVRRILLRISYDGTGYVGWQKQENGTAVEEVINRALKELTGEDIRVIGASRTDSGVHALDNVAVFDTESKIPADKFSFALNRYLPGDIVIQSSRETDPDFHPRYADCRKTYEYSIYNAPHNNPLLDGYSFFVHNILDTEAMRKAADCLTGEHDFASFCSSGAQVKTTIRKVYSIDIEEQPVIFGGERNDTFTPRLIIIRINGNGFLYNMVRIIAGTLIEAGKGLIAPDSVKDILGSCDRACAGPTAPARGLVLKEISYLCS